MAEYKTEKGFAVQTLSSDTAASEAATGTWASGGTMNTARSDLAGLGIETSAMAVAGYASTGTQSAVETYDGSSWTEITELNSARNSLGGFGATNTAAIACGGRTPTVAKTESWNGSAWTEVNDMNVARFAMNISGAGTQTSGLSSGGNGPAGQDAVEVWDGTNWTAAGAELNTTRAQGSASGQSNSSAAAVGGYGGSPDAPLATTELWNGSSWTEVADLNTARYSLVCTGNGTSLLVNGGEGSGTGILAITESFDGTSWTEVADLSDTIKDHGGTGYSSTNTTSLSFAGKSPSSSYKNTSEEWTTTPAATFTQINLGQVYFNSTSNAFKVTKNVFGTGAWSSGDNLNQARSQGGNNASGGSASIGLVSGGQQYSPGISYNNTEIYNGTAWTEVNNLTSTRGYSTGAGTPAGALVVSGTMAPSPGAGGVGGKTNVESFDGTNWTEVNDVNQSRFQGAGAGTQTSAIFVGGEGGSPWNDNKNKTELWDGSSWTEVNNLNDGRTLVGGAGLSTSAIVAGGTPGSGATANTETWDGTSWTEVNNLNTARMGANLAAHSNTAALAFGGYLGPPGNTAATETWNGTSWTEVADIANTRYNGTSAGSSTSAWLAGGSPGTPNATEEWLVPATVTNTTITVS
jgi:hypothetical protein